MSYQDPAQHTSWADAVTHGARLSEDPPHDYVSTDFQQDLSPVPTSSLVEDALEQAGSSLEQALSCLWNLDINRLIPSKDYRLDPQSRSRSTSHDAASTPLILEVSDNVWEKKTYCSFKKLLDNYTADTGVPERVSHTEREEEENFLNAICDTPCIQFTQRWLAEHSSQCASSMEEFKDLLRDIWFQLYSRDASRDSSGFEHVFCGEIDHEKVKGLHNFIQVYVEEQRGNFDYKGYLNVYGDPTHEAPPAGQQMLIIRFEWFGYMKSVSSMFIGTSPEFEIALYSMLWLCRQSEAEIQLGPYSLRVKVYDMAGKIGSAFPELLDVDESLLEESEPAPSGTVYNELGSSTEAEETSDNYENSFPSLS